MYLIISVGKKDIVAQEWKPDYESDSCKYCEPFDSWEKLLNKLGDYMDGYLYVRVVDDTLTC